jgi:hypothetical protein
MGVDNANEVGKPGGENTQKFQITLPQLNLASNDREQSLALEEHGGSGIVTYSQSPNPADVRVADAFVARGVEIPVKFDNRPKYYPVKFIEKMTDARGVTPALAD